MHGDDLFSLEVVNALLDYDELGPDYTLDAVAWVTKRGGLAPGSPGVDLAVGTGQLSRQFTLLALTLWPVEPAANMRALLEERLRMAPFLALTGSRSGTVRLSRLPWETHSTHSAARGRS